VTSRGFFVTFEGVDGCGKTTQAALAGKFLASLGIPHLMTSEPGGTALGAIVRRLILHEKSLELCPETELLLFAAARFQHVNRVVAPALSDGKWVLCDRFGDATVAYQGYGRGLDLTWINQLNHFSVGDCLPERTFLFDLPVEIGLSRARRQTEADTGQAGGDLMEAQNVSFHHRVREGYLSLARRFPQRFLIIDAKRSVEAIHADVCRHLKTLM
jgi:dTMP kinase